MNKKNTMIRYEFYNYTRQKWNRKSLGGKGEMKGTQSKRNEMVEIKMEMKTYM